MREPIKFDTVNAVCERLVDRLDMLSDLVAVLTRKVNEAERDRFNANDIELLLVFNGERKAELPRNCEQVTLENLLSTSALELRLYDGTIIAFSALSLALPALVTSGPRHRSMEEVHRKLGQPSILAETEHELAEFLFNTLFERGEIDEQAPEASPAEWLDKAAKLLALSLPRHLQELDDIRGLVAVIPDHDFQRYLVEGYCTLVYVAGDESERAFRTVGRDSDWTEMSTNSQLCATFEEVSVLYPQIDPTQHGFVDLRKIIRRVPTHTTGRSGNRVPGSKYANQIATTIARLAAVCRDQSNKQGGSKRRLRVAAMTLEAEHWAAGKPLDGLVGMAFGSHPLQDAPKDEHSSAYYLTVPEGMHDHGLRSLESLLRSPCRSITECDADRNGYVVSLRALRRALGAGDSWRWVPLHDILFRLDRPDLLAKAAFLVSRTMRQKSAWQDFRELEMISNLAAVACHTYGLTDLQRWHRGDYEHTFALAYDNLDDCINKLKEAAETPWKSYYQCLMDWWDRRSTRVGERKRLAESAQKILTCDFPIGQRLRKVQKMRQMFAALLAMTSEVWDPSIIRERLLQVGFTELGDFGITRPKDVFDPNRDPLLPSPLFLAELKHLLALAQTSQKIRTSKLPLLAKQEQLEEQGRILGRRIGVDFDQHRRSGDEHAIEFLGQSALLFVPWHERLWLEMIYTAMLSEHKRVINEWYSQPVEVSAVSPDPVSPRLYTTLELSLTATPGHSLTGVTVSLRPPDQPVYHLIDDDPTHILTGDQQTQAVTFNVVFNTEEHSVPLQLIYKDGTRAYFDQYWVDVAGRDKKIAPMYNPYVFGSVIDNPANYYGREHQLERLLDQFKPSLDGQPPQRLQALHVHGTRRAGKTSLLYILRRIIEDPKEKTVIREHYGISPAFAKVLDRIHPVYYTLELMTKTSDGRFDFEAFARSLLRLVCESVQLPTTLTEQLLAQLKYEIKQGGAVPSSLEKCLRHVLEMIPNDQYMFIVLDELDKLHSERDGLTTGYLRALIGASLPRVVWVVVTTFGLPKDWDSPIQNLFGFIRLTSLTKDEAARLILEPARRAHLFFPPESVAHIIAETGCHPYFLQVVCNYVVQQLIQEHNTYADRYLVESVVADICDLSDEARLHCQEIWNRLSGWGKLLVANLARQAEALGKDSLTTIMLNQVSARVPNIEESDVLKMISDAMDEMTADKMLRTSGSALAFAIPIFGRWVSRVEYSVRVNEAILEIDIIRKRIATSPQEDNHAQE